MTDNKSSLLSKKQRKRLKEDDDLDRMTRSRIRDRVNQGVRDFVTLSDHLPDDDRRKLFEKGFGTDLQQSQRPTDEDRASEYYRGLVAQISFLYSGLKDRGFDIEDIERLIEDAILEAEADEGVIVAGESHRTADPDVSISPNVEYVVGDEEARQKLQTKKTMTADEYGRAVMDVDRHKLVELLEEEGKL